MLVWRNAIFRGVLCLYMAINRFVMSLKEFKIFLVYLIKFYYLYQFLLLNY